MLVVSVNAIEPAHMRSSLLSRICRRGKPRVCIFAYPEKKGKRPAFCLETCFGPGEKTLSERPGESYFDKLVHLLMENKNGSISFATEDYCWPHFNEKDL